MKHDIAAYPQQTHLEKKLHALYDTLGSTRERAQSQQRQLETLQQGLRDYRVFVERMKERAALAEKAIDLLTIQPPLPAAAPRSLSWLPYVALAVVGVSLSFGASWRKPARPALRLAAVPVPSSAQDKRPTPDEESNDEVLSLVYAFVPPGGRQRVQDVLKPELEASSGGSPWVIVHVDDKTALVSFRPYGESLETAPVYEFVVDTADKTVIASPETIVNLKGGDIASAR